VEQLRRDLFDLLEHTLIDEAAKPGMTVPDQRASRWQKDLVLPIIQGLRVQDMDERIAIGLALQTAITVFCVCSFKPGGEQIFLDDCRRHVASLQDLVERSGSQSRSCDDGRV
jgi:hypothetical protein